MRAWFDFSLHCRNRGQRDLSQTGVSSRNSDLLQLGEHNAGRTGSSIEQRKSAQKTNLNFLFAFFFFFPDPFGSKHRQADVHRGWDVTSAME